MLCDAALRPAEFPFATPFLVERGGWLLEQIAEVPYLPWDAERLLLVWATTEERRALEAAGFDLEAMADA
jgi:hypothetical protein